MEGAFFPPMYRVSTAGSSGCELWGWQYSPTHTHTSLEPNRLPNISPQGSYWWFGGCGPQPEKPGQRSGMLMIGTNWGTLFRAP